MSYRYIRLNSQTAFRPCLLKRPPLCQRLLPLVPPAIPPPRLKRPPMCQRLLPLVPPAITPPRLKRPPLYQRLLPLVPQKSPNALILIIPSSSAKKRPFKAKKYAFKRFFNLTKSYHKPPFSLQNVTNKNPTS